MQQLVEVLAKYLVDEPEAINVTQVEKDKYTLLELKVAPDDMGKVIGKHGKIAKAIRTVVKAGAVKEGKRVVVEILQ